LKRVTNCILQDGNKVLMLQKPSKDWWVVPGGKMEQTESIQEAVEREYLEETNLKLISPTLKGVFNIVVKELDEIVEEWMMFTFYADRYTGTLNEYCEEGILEWKHITEIPELPKAEGDNVYLSHILQGNELITGKFYYTTDYKLISYSVDTNNLETVRN